MIYVNKWLSLTVGCRFIDPIDILHICVVSYNFETRILLPTNAYYWSENLVVYVFVFIVECTVYELYFSKVIDSIMTLSINNL